MLPLCSLATLWSAHVIFIPCKDHLLSEKAHCINYQQHSPLTEVLLAALLQGVTLMHKRINCITPGTSQIGDARKYSESCPAPAPGLLYNVSVINPIERQKGVDFMSYKIF